MTDTSRATSTILEAIDGIGNPQWIAQAAIRAAVEQVLPEEPEPPVISPALVRFLWQDRQDIRRDFLAIATGLKGVGNG